MLPVDVAIHIVVLLAERTGQRRLTMVLIGEKRTNFQLITQERTHFPVVRFVKPVEKAVEFRPVILIGDGDAVFAAVGFERTIDEGCAFSISEQFTVIVEADDHILVDDADAGQRGFFRQGKPGVRIAMKQQLSGEAFQIFPHFGNHHRRKFVILHIAETRRALELSGNPVAQREKIDRQVESALFERMNKIVEAIHFLRIEGDGVVDFPPDQLPVVVVEPDTVVTDPGEIIRHRFRLFVGRCTGGSTEIGPVKADRAIRLFLEDETTIPHLKEAVLSGGGIEQE